MRKPPGTLGTHGAVIAVAAMGVYVVPTIASDHPRIVPVGVHPGQSESRITAVNADGSAAVGDSGAAVPEPALRWTATAGLQDLGSLPGCWPLVRATSISGDGSRIAGFCGGLEHLWPFVWSASTGMQGLPFLGGMSETQTVVEAMTPDGSVLVGFSQASWMWTDQHAARWVHGPGGWVLEDLGLPAEAFSAGATAVSDDGAVLAGYAWGTFQGASSHRRAWRWTAQSGFELLERLPAAPSCDASGISSDGNTIAGTCGTRPFIWTESGGTQELPRLPHWTSASIWDLSGDGSVAVGMASVPASPGRAVMWIGGNAVEVKEHLEALGINLAGWSELRIATSVNAAGDVIAGTGTFRGVSQGWVAYLSGCYADCDGSGSLNVDDFTCFINEFATAQGLPHEQQITHYANCDESTTEPVLTVDDFTCFINSFAAACP